MNAKELMPYVGTLCALLHNAPSGQGHADDVARVDLGLSKDDAANVVSVALQAGFMVYQSGVFTLTAAGRALGHDVAALELAKNSLN